MLQEAKLKVAVACYRCGALGAGALGVLGLAFCSDECLAECSQQGGNDDFLALWAAIITVRMLASGRTWL